VVISAGSASSTSRGTDIVGNADDPVTKELVDPFALLVGNKSFCLSLVISVGVALATEITPKTG
jgi:hypothetical protein